MQSTNSIRNSFIEEAQIGAYVKIHMLYSHKLTPEPNRLCAFANDVDSIRKA